MKPEQVVPIMRQRQVVATERSKLEQLLKVNPEQHESSEGLSLQERFDRIVDAIGLMRGADKESPIDYHHKITGRGPILKINHEINGEIIELHLIISVNWLNDGGEVNATWFTYAARYGGADLPAHEETVSQRMINEAARRPQSPYPEKVADDLSNLEWSVASYKEAISNLTPVELMELGFPNDFVNQFMAESGKTYLAP